MIKVQSKQENIIYLVMWAALFAAPILSLYIRTLGDSAVSFQWSEVWFVWRNILPFLLLFLVHNLLLAPLLIYRHRRTLYASIVFIVIAAFTVYQCATKPRAPMDGPFPPMPEQVMKDRPQHGPEDRPQHGPEDQPHHGPKHDMRRPPVIMGEHDVVAVVILILMFGMNLGVKGYFKSQEDEKKRQAAEKENLTQQLEYLKYQLNPHFLMNTLNNIHALIEIEPPKAQEAVIQLSKILRYVLYESNMPRVLMRQEVAFMESYVQLMRMRFSDRLRFTANTPDDGSDVTIPPLLFISFVENAFKHGVSYQQDSFIEIAAKRYGHNPERLLWTCRNSKHSATANVPKEGGVGMSNVRQRLDLIFGQDYTLDVIDGDDVYEVRLDIPLDKKEDVRCKR